MTNNRTPEDQRTNRHPPIELFMNENYDIQRIGEPAPARPTDTSVTAEIRIPANSTDARPSTSPRWPVDAIRSQPNPNADMAATSGRRQAAQLSIFDFPASEPATRGPVREVPLTMYTPPPHARSYTTDHNHASDHLLATAMGGMSAPTILDPQNMYQVSARGVAPGRWRRITTLGSPARDPSWVSDSTPPAYVRMMQEYAEGVELRSRRNGYATNGHATNGYVTRVNEVDHVEEAGEREDSSESEE